MKEEGEKCGAENMSWDEYKNHFHFCGGEEEPVSEDVVNKPSHYTKGKIEVIDFLEDQSLDFRLANVIKYVCRARYKGKELEDLKKASWYLSRYIQNLEKGAR